jgi:hypothetical protein
MTIDIAELGRRLKPQNLRKADAEPVTSTVKAESVCSQMLFFPETVGAMPTEITRTSLFSLLSATKKSRRDAHDETIKIESRTDITVKHTGKALDEYDQTAWMCAMRLCRNARLGERVYMRITDVLRDLCLTDTKPNRDAIIDRFNRLSHAVIQLELTRKKRKMTMVTGLMKWGFEIDLTTGAKSTSEIYLRLDPDGACMFDNLAYQPWEVRTALHSPAAMALMTYASGHAAGKPHCVSLADLQRMMGHEGRLRVFRDNIMEATGELEAQGFFVKGASGLKGSGRVERIYWVRTPSKVTSASK